MGYEESKIQEPPKGEQDTDHRGAMVLHHAQGQGTLSPKPHQHSAVNPGGLLGTQQWMDDVFLDL